MGVWIGVDFDGTLVEYHSYNGIGTIGKSIMPMVRRVKRWLDRGIEVRIVTARVNHIPSVVKREVAGIEKWCLETFGIILPITCSKDFEMIELWDDRAVPISTNTGRILSCDELNRMRNYERSFSYVDSKNDLKKIKEDNSE